MLDSLERDLNRCAPQNGHISFLIMATLWVPDLPEIKGFAVHPWHSILITANGTSYAWSSQVCGLLKCFSSLKSPKVLKSGWSCHGNQIFYSHNCVASRRAHQVSMISVCGNLTKMVLFIYLMLYWVAWMTWLRPLICTLYTFFKPKYPNGKRRFQPFLEFYYTFCCSFRENTQSFALKVRQ